MNAVSSLENREFTFGKTGVGDVIQCAIVNDGKRVPMGSMKIGTIEVPSFGPQLHPLDETAFFGVQRMEADWSILPTQKDIWLEHRVSSHGFEVRFTGITSTSPVSFVFFVKADHAFIKEQIFYPKNLERYCSNSQPVIFQSQNSRFSVTNLNPTKMELIPLAGSNCFWGSNFLLAFDVPVHDGKVVFQFA